MNRNEDVTKYSAHCTCEKCGVSFTITIDPDIRFELLMSHPEFFTTKPGYYAQTECPICKDGTQLNFVLER